MNHSKVYLPTDNLPSFWWNLSETDKYQYNCLRLALAVSTDKNQRNQRITSFKKCIDAVRAFAVRGDINDKLRSYVCGIIWLPEGIAVNTHYLKALISKCKSSINGSLQKMGYTTTINRVEAASIMANTFPNLKDNTSELRKWSIRKMPSPNDSTPQKEEKQQITESQIKFATVEENYPIVPSTSDPELFQLHSPEQNFQAQVTVGTPIQQKPIVPISVAPMEDDHFYVQFEERYHYDDWDLDDYHEPVNSLYFYPN